MCTLTHNTWTSDESLTPEVSMQSDDHKHQRDFNNNFQALALRLTLDLFRHYPGPFAFICRYLGDGGGLWLTVKIIP